MKLECGKLNRVFFGNKAVTVTVSGLVILFIGIIMMQVGFPKILDSQIHKRILLKKGTDMYRMWLEPPFPLTFKVYIFNVTNPEDVSNGSKPRLQELGPYVYKEYRSRENVRFEGEETLVYDLKKLYYFSEELSEGASEDDEITVLNVAYMGLVLKANRMVPSMMSQVNMVLPHLFNHPEDIFMKTTVRELLFEGIMINCTKENALVGLVCEAIKNNLPPSMRIADPPEEGFYFSMFHKMNGTLEGPFSISTGLGPGGIKHIGEIKSFENETTVDAWEGECGMINGSDSSIFGPIDESAIPRRVYIFQADVCRSLYAVYKGRSQAMGLPSLRYEGDRSLLESKESNPDNACFCEKDWSVTKVGCEMDGVLGLNDCQGVPVVVSFPHFYLGSPALLNFVEDGMYPMAHLHKTYIDIEPRTGAVIRGYKRLQFNMELAPIPRITILKGVPQGLFPVLWAEEGATIDSEARELLNNVYNIIKAVKVIQWMVVATGVVLLLAACRLSVPQSRRFSNSWTPRDSRPHAAQPNARTENKIYNNQVGVLEVVHE